MKIRTSLKPTSEWETCRKIKVPGMGQERDAALAKEVVASLAGVSEVEAIREEHLLIVRYDASILAYQTIKRTLSDVQMAPCNTWWHRFLAGCYQFADTNAMNNAAIHDRPCCNKPPKAP